MLPPGKSEKKHEFSREKTSSLTFVAGYKQKGDSNCAEIFVESGHVFFSYLDHTSGKGALHFPNYPPNKKKRKRKKEREKAADMFQVQ